MEAIMEESELESDDDEEYFGICPISRTKTCLHFQIVIKSCHFCQTFSLIYFPMGRAHEQAYQDLSVAYTDHVNLHLSIDNFSLIVHWSHDCHGTS